jgi:hypothetical protein
MRLISASLGDCSSGREFSIACVEIEALRPIRARSARSYNIIVNNIKEDGEREMSNKTMTHIIIHLNSHQLT